MAARRMRQSNGPTGSDMPGGRRMDRSTHARPMPQGRPRPSGVPVILLVIAVVLAAVCGALVDRFLLGHGTGGSLGGKTVISEGELGKSVATYKYGGSTVTLSARDVLEGQGLLESAKNADGSYNMPTADDVLAVARGRIIAQEAERLGITASEQDVLAYAQSTLGTRTLADVATTYGTTEDAVYAQLLQATLMQRLRAQVVSEARPEAPALPPEPEEGEEVVALPKYGSYIVGLAGQEWDTAADTWASADGPFAVALADYEVSANSATYDAALQAYWVAYQHYAEQDAEVAALWTNYVNGLLDQASVAICTLVI